MIRKKMKVLLSLLLFVSFILNSQSTNDTGDYQKKALDGNLPIFYQSLKEKIDFTLSWEKGTEKDFNLWREKARKKMFELLLQKEDNIQFQPKVIEEVDRGKYIGKKIVFNLTKESRVVALMLIPKGKGPFPAVLLLHDHGAKFDIGKEKMIEPWDNEERIKSAKAWSEKFFSKKFVGDELAKRGYVVLAVDAFGWGDRGTLTYEIQQAVASNFFNLGSSLAGLMAYEDVRSAEFLASLPEVDKTKVGALGFSMGAFRAWQVAALSDKITCAISICWITTIKGVMTPGNNILRGQSAYFMLHPGVFNYFDFPDIASIACPKPMLFYNGGKDGLFPVDSVKDAYDKMKKVWDSQNASDKLATKIWEDQGHVFIDTMQDEAFKWLDKNLKNKK